MLFEPCGDLLKDYGAYCETLRVTEREEVYSAIRTRSVEAPRLPVSGEEHDAASTRVDADEVRGSGKSVTAPQTKSPRRASRVSAKEATGRRRRSSVGSSVDAGSLTGGMCSASNIADASAAPSVANVTLTSITLHYPVFCLNQRDMTPLCRAIPHCPSLLSIELVGCGLSVQSYMKLVEAVYRSPRVITVAVDFNVPFIEYHRQKRFSAMRGTPEAGFVIDPTLHPPNYFAEMTHGSISGPQLLPNRTASYRASVTSAVSQNQRYDASADTMPPPDSSTTYPAPAAADANPTSAAAAAENQVRNGSLRKFSEGASRSLTQLDQRMSQISYVDTAGAAGMDMNVHGLFAMGGGPSGVMADDETAFAALYLYPTQYCGLDQLPTPLELQIQEEKEKKGKVEGKKMQQLQAQRDTLRAFDQQHRTPVPKSWDGILLTGIHHLSLRGNHIDDATVGRLTQVLMENPQSRLVSLNLWGNEITDVGAAMLARLLRTNNMLHTLDLGNNLLSDVGLLELIHTFLMRQLTSPEDIFAARHTYLTRRGASEDELKAASQPLVLSEIPSYEDLYAYWWHTQQQTVHFLSLGELSSSQTDTTGGVNSTSSRLPALTSAAYPPPPPRDAQSSPTAGVNPKRTSPARSKATKSESLTGTMSSAAYNMMMSSSANRVANRHTVGFDKDCVRVRHIADNDAAIRIPGNTVLEVLNVGENKYITVAGAREAARLLWLREPTDTAEMLAMVEVHEPAGPQSVLSSPPTPVSATPDGAAKRSQGLQHRPGASVGNSCTSTSANVSNSGFPMAGATVIRAPELHCAGLRLRVCSVGSHSESNRTVWPQMDAAQEEINAALAMWVSR